MSNHVRRQLVRLLPVAGGIMLLVLAATLYTDAGPPPQANRPATFVRVAGTEPDAAAAGPAAKAPVAPPAPRAEIDLQQHDFGWMDPLQQSSHTFEIRNRGDAPLTLTPGPTSCKCAKSFILTDVVPPGGSGLVRLEWITKPETGPFLQSAAIRTNDPAWRQIQLRISGRVRTRLAAEPAELIFSAAAGTGPVTARTVVYSPVWESFTLDSVRTRLPGVTWQVSPAAPRQLDRLGGRAGYVVTVQLPTDRPPGELRGRLEMFARPPAGADEPQTAAIPIRGRISSPIGLSGPALGADDVLHLGTHEEGTTTRTHLLLKLRDGRDQLEVRQITTRPDFLQVRVEPYRATPGTRGLYRIDVEVPKSAPPGIWLAPRLGELVLETDHPGLPELRLGVELGVTRRESRPHSRDLAHGKP